MEEASPELLLPLTPPRGDHAPCSSPPLPSAAPRGSDSALEDLQAQPVGRFGSQLLPLADHLQALLCLAVAW